MKRLAWFSCGAASAVAAKLITSRHPSHDDVTVMYTDPGSEHPDSLRFLHDVERWIGRPITIIRSGAYADTWAVWEARRFIVGPHGAPCTIELKKKPRHLVEAPYDIQVFGYTATEKWRADRFRGSNPDVRLETPLIPAGLTKQDCLAIIERAGIELPEMYKLGYSNNNCIGCPKGGMGYWNHIRQDFPDTFDRMARLERDLGHAILKDTSGPVYLDLLDPGRGNYSTEPDIECSLLCAIAEEEIA